jgi:hypothetical protein
MNRPTRHWDKTALVEGPPLPGLELAGPQHPQGLGRNVEYDDPVQLDGCIVGILFEMGKESASTERALRCALAPFGSFHLW